MATLLSTFPFGFCFDSALCIHLSSASSAEQRPLTMASKLTKLRMPQYSLRQPNGPAFTYFLKTVFEYNYQRKDLMAESRDVIINFWKNMVYSAYRGDIDRARLMKQVGINYQYIRSIRGH